MDGFDLHSSTNCFSWFTLAASMAVPLLLSCFCLQFPEEIQRIVRTTKEKSVKSSGLCKGPFPSSSFFSLGFWIINLNALSLAVHFTCVLWGGFSFEKSFEGWREIEAYA